MKEQLIQHLLRAGFIRTSLGSEVYGLLDHYVELCDRTPEGSAAVYAYRLEEGHFKSLQDLKLPIDYAIDVFSFQCFLHVSGVLTFAEFFRSSQPETVISVLEPISDVLNLQAAALEFVNTPTLIRQND